MSKIIGRQRSLGIGKEISRGTAVTPAVWVPMMELDFEDRTKNVINESSIGRLEGSDDEIVTTKYGEATLKSKVKDSSIGYILLSLFGSVSSAQKSSPNGGVYDHTFSVGQTCQHQSLTIVEKTPNVDRAITNAVVDSFKITAERNNYVMFEAHALGSASESDSNTASFSAENDFSSKDVTFRIENTQADLAGGSNVSVRNISIEFSSNAELDESLGTTAIDDVLNRSFAIKGSVTLVHNATTYDTLALAGTNKAIRIQLANTGVTIGSSANPTLQIDLHKCVLSNRQLNGGLNDIVEESFDFTAHYSLTDSKMVTAILTNETASY